MRSNLDPDRLISDWLDDIAPPRASDGLLDQVLGTTAQVRRRSSWVIPERWLPMALFLRPRAYARMAGVTLLIILSTLLAVAGVVGSQPARPPAPPFGLARNGLIAFDAAGDIWVADPDGSNPHALTSGPGVDIDPTWSPDGTTLAYWSLDDAGRSEEQAFSQDSISGLLASSTASLMVTVEDGRSPSTLVTGVTLDSWGLPPSWSPDSARLAFAHLVDGISVIDLVDFDGNLTGVADGEAPSWSPDGSRIALKRPDKGVEVVDIDGGDEPRRVTTATGDGFAFSLPQWSPDGSMIAFYAGDDGAHDIWVVNADGTDEHELSADVQDEYWPYWSPDGSRIAYGRTMSDATQVAGNYVVVGPAGQDEVVLPAATLAAGAPTTWSPDGTMLLAFVSDESSPGGVSVVLLDATGADPDPLATIEVASPWNSGSWQRLAP